MKSIGISPKVLNPTLCALALGVILLLAGFDVEGRTLIAAAVGVGGIGFASNPADVYNPDLYPDPHEGPNPPAREDEGENAAA